MISILTYRVQEQAFRSLSPGSQGRLRLLARSLESDSNTTKLVAPDIKPGTRLVRQWRNQGHVVNVEAKGYEYQGVRHRSLSEVARLITGTRWSGPLFFGIQKEPSRSASKEAE